MKLRQEKGDRHPLLPHKPEALEQAEGFLLVAFKEEQENPRESWGQGASRQMNTKCQSMDAHLG